VSKPITLTQHAGNAVGNGLSWDKAFAAITATPARWFGLGKATAERGQAATLVIWDGDPLDVTSAPTAMWIDGKAQSLESRMTALRDRYNPTNTDTRPHKYR
jgi:imidazolonepropionase-like amidohydrolase